MVIIMVIIWLMMDNNNWLVVEPDPSEKCEFVSGDDFPWKIKFMFQTTNQIKLLDSWDKQYWILETKLAAWEHSRHGMTYWLITGILGVNFGELVWIIYHKIDWITIIWRLQHDPFFMWPNCDHNSLTWHKVLFGESSPYYTHHSSVRSRREVVALFFLGNRSYPLDIICFKGKHDRNHKDLS